MAYVQNFEFGAGGPCDNVNFGQQALSRQTYYKIRLSSAAMEGADASLKEIDSIVSELVERKDLIHAVQLSLRALDIRRAFFGTGSLEFEAARVTVSNLVVDAAEAQQAKFCYKESSELLAYVDRLTAFPLKQYPPLERSRKVTRMKMMLQQMIIRHHQGRDRSAISFGRHLLTLAKETMAFYILPLLHLNLASVLSALKQHGEALKHCFMAYHSICRILESLEKCEKGFISESLCLEQLDNNVENSERSFTSYEKCKALLTDEFDELAFVGPTAPRSISPESPKELLRWGGFLALAFRSIAVEQEHLHQYDTSLLTYKVSQTTACKCLGANHPITQQCEQALRDAEGSMRQRRAKQKNAATVDRSGTSPNALKVSAKNQSAISDKTVWTHPSSDGAKHKDVAKRKLKERPPWNATLSSTVISRNLQSAPSRIESTILDQNEKFLLEVKRLEHDERQHRPQTHQDVQRKNTNAESREPLFEPISRADYSFLQNTFKLGYDMSISRGIDHETVPLVLPEKKRVLAVERRLAQALASQEEASKNA
jgi:hypothetical protein